MLRWAKLNFGALTLFAAAQVHVSWNSGGTARASRRWSHLCNSMHCTPASRLHALLRSIQLPFGFLVLQRVELLDANERLTCILACLH